MQAAPEPDALIRQTIARHVSPSARVVAIEEAPLAGPERGRAPVRRYAVTIEDGHQPPRRLTLFTKEATRLERRVLDLLGGRDLAVPFSYAADMETEGPALVCLEDGGTHPSTLTGGLAGSLAGRVAAIHHAFFGRGDLGWLPRADRAGLLDTMLGDWRHWWERRMAEPDVATEFGDQTGALEAAEARFLDWLDEQWRAGDALTLIHGDMHPGQVVAAGDAVTLIDWEHAAYGPLYLDLPNVFTPDTSQSYRDALARLGYSIPADIFRKQCREAGRYVGFKYMGFVLRNWSVWERDVARRRVRNVITTALTGEQPRHLAQGEG